MDTRLTADEDRPPYVHLSWAEGRRPRPNINAHRHVSPMTDGAWHGLLGPCCGIGHRRRRDARTGATVGKAETLRRRGRPHTSHLAIGIVTQRAKTRGTRGLVRSRRRRRRVEPGPTKEASLFIWDNARVRAYPSASHHRAATLGASSSAHAAPAPSVRGNWTHYRATFFLLGEGGTPLLGARGAAVGVYC